MRLDDFSVSNIKTTDVKKKNDETNKYKPSLDNFWLFEHGFNP